MTLTHLMPVPGSLQGCKAVAECKPPWVELQGFQGRGREAGVETASVPEHGNSLQEPILRIENMGELNPLV